MTRWWPLLLLAVTAQAPAPPPQCPGATPVHHLPADIQILRIKADNGAPMQDNDGDVWIVLRQRSTGRLSVGFVSHLTGNFCPVAEAQTNPET